MPVVALRSWSSGPEGGSLENRRNWQSSSSSCQSDTQAIASSSSAATGSATVTSLSSMPGARTLAGQVRYSAELEVQVHESRGHTALAALA